MLTLDLDKLFTAKSLQVFRESWGKSPQDANRLALKISAMFEEKKGNGASDTGDDIKADLLESIVMALVGSEPDFDTWVEILAGGSLALRPKATYAHVPNESPSRSLERQRKRIDSLIDRDLPPHQQELERVAYLDVLRQILASLIIREMRRAVSAGHALGTAWPLLIASREHLSPDDRGLLHAFGGNSDFVSDLGQAIQVSIQRWVDDHHGGVPPKINNKEAHKGHLPPGVRYHDALVYVDFETAAVDSYRIALWRELGMNREPAKLAGSRPVLSELAAKDSAEIRTSCKTHTQTYRFFTEANEVGEKMEYSKTQEARLREYLPLMSEDVSHDLQDYARIRAERRRKIRSDQPGLLPDHDLQEEILQWVEAGNLPPPNLKLHHAGYLEEEVLRFYKDRFADERWDKCIFSWPGYVPF